MRFRQDTHAFLGRIERAWARLFQHSGPTIELVAMVTLQMYHYVGYTPAAIDMALMMLKDQPCHNEYRALLEYLAKEEHDHHQIALSDLHRLGYDRDECQKTLPLPTTFNIPAENRLGMQTHGPYYYLGALYASETAGAELADRFDEWSKTGSSGVPPLRFYALHGTGCDHDSRTRDCFQHYFQDEALRRALVMGFVTVSRNLVLLADEVRQASVYPTPFQLPARGRSELNA